MKLPDEPLRCLMIHPKFSLFNYWNYVDACEAIGAKANQPPLGLLTVAAILPENWQIEVVDLNVREIEPEEWEQADLVLTGGMLPQQKGIIDLIKKARAEGKYVVVGGPDPSSQPELYEEANAIVMGEGEITIPLWLQSWMRGEPDGIFSSDEKPDITQTPIPRYELIDFDDYLHVGVQYSRGCPFNCEFCDIIELYGRKPRVKTTEQFLAELETIYKLGYRGWVDIVDDNFIGNKRNIKRMLPELQTWSKRRRYPFFFSTEASMNLGDDEKLLQMMQAVDFRYVFMGVETPDPDLLLMTQKSQNTVRPIKQRIDNIYRHGISVAAGFIIGFDNEKEGMDRSIITCIEETGIITAMVGLLVALPKTQLTRRLQKEGRLIASDTSVYTDEKAYQAKFADRIFEGEDQTTAGLNYITTRDRLKIYSEYKNIVQTVYSPKNYFDRVLRCTNSLQLKRKHFAVGHELKRKLRGGGVMIYRFTRNKSTRWYFWRNFMRLFFTSPYRFEFAMNMMAGYLHFQKQTAYLSDQIDKQAAYYQERKDRGSFPMSTAQTKSAS